MHGRENNEKVPNPHKNKNVLKVCCWVSGKMHDWVKYTEKNVRDMEIELVVSLFGGSPVIVKI